jgi:hypothetical protein
MLFPVDPRRSQGILCIKSIKMQRLAMANAGREPFEATYASV